MRVDEVCARHDANDFIAFRVQDRHLPPAAGRHDFLQVIEGIAGSNKDCARVHEDAGVGHHFMAQRAVHIAAGNQANNLAFFDHRVAFKAVAFHQVGHGFHRHVRGKKQGIAGHDLLHSHGRMHNFGRISTTCW